MFTEAIGALVFGTIAGWLLRSIYQGAGPSSGDLLGAGVTIAAAFWIQRALTRQNELNRVPLESIARLFTSIEHRLDACLQAGCQENRDINTVVERCRLAANEINWLRSVIRALKLDEADIQRLLRDYFHLKQCLTDEDAVPRAKAEALVRRMKLQCLRQQWIVCQHVLDHPQAIATFV